MKERDGSYDLLVDLLHQASQLEHSLLDAYLFTASSLKSMPQEFATINGQENLRRAIQYERVRAWKQSILMVSHEEMLHLHYVQCLIRALGENPYFTLPERDEESGFWIIPNWQARVGETPTNEGEGVEIPMEPLTFTNIKRFVLFEASDELQDQDPFAGPVLDLFNELYKFELDLRFESMLLNVQDEKKRSELKNQLHDLYTTLPPLAAKAAQPSEMLAAETAEELPTFQSIADFYNLGIEPLYHQAFDFGWVKETNRRLNNEIAFPGTPAAEGFLPVGPIYRSKNFEAAATEDVEDPLRDYLNVEDVIKEIVEEGEGMTGFDDQAKALLAKVAELGGARAYLQALLKDQNDPTPSTPTWLQSGELLRQSHLYHFAMIMIELKQELDLTAEHGVIFDPSRKAEVVEGNADWQKIVEELPAQFNACYLVLLAWLARMYEIRAWEDDKPRRVAIEMLASWPLMSMAIRPFLELASFFPINTRQLFKLDPDSLPKLPVHSQQLYKLYVGSERSEEINKKMDYYAVRVLSDAAAWAAGKHEDLADNDAFSKIPENAQKMILARLRSLSTLNEFQRQFPFRVEGGYSNTMPDRSYIQTHPGGQKYAENPAAVNPNPAAPPPIPIFKNNLLLRLRFSGYGLVQLATDPDPTFEEAGCTGTQMLHPADGDRRFDRALIWQNKAGNVILRGPKENLPPLGVNCTEVALIMSGDQTQVGYIPLSLMSSTGAVQASGVQQELQVQDAPTLVAFDPQDIFGKGRKLRIDLQEKDGQVPFLNGLNHIIWQDGEPIDPFILSVWADGAPSKGDGSGITPLFEREVYNEGQSILEMDPLQRIYSSRAPVGFDNYQNIPPWVQNHLYQPSQAAMQQPGYPISYLNQRAGVLINELAKQLDARNSSSQATIDTIVSLAERLRLISVPRGTTVGWLTALLHYGHSLSGQMSTAASDNPILSALAKQTGLHLNVAAAGDRHASNTRWLINYTLGVQDTDALSSLVYGELYLPLTIESTTKQIQRSFKWAFPESIRDAVVAYSCNFAKPFWANFDVRGNRRVTKLPDGTVITETLIKSHEAGYSYSMSDSKIPDLDYTGVFAVTNPVKGMFDLTWKVEFTTPKPETILKVLDIIQGGATQMESALRQHFMPDLSA